MDAVDVLSWRHSRPAGSEISACDQDMGILFTSGELD